MLLYCADREIGVITWSPPGRGRLSRPADEATEQHDRKVLDVVGDVAREVGRSRAEAGLR